MRLLYKIQLFLKILIFVFWRVLLNRGTILITMAIDMASTFEFLLLRALRLQRIFIIYSLISCEVAKQSWACIGPLVGYCYFKLFFVIYLLCVLVDSLKRLVLNVIAITAICVLVMIP